MGKDERGREQEFTECACPGESFFVDNSVEHAEQIPWNVIDANFAPTPNLATDITGTGGDVERQTGSEFTWEAGTISAVSVPVFLVLLLVTATVSYFHARRKSERANPDVPIHSLWTLESLNDVHV